MPRKKAVTEKTDPTSTSAVSTSVSTSTPTPTPTSAPTSASTNYLTISDLKRGGDKGIKRAEIPDIEKGGQPGVLFYKRISTAVGLDLNELRGVAEGGDADPAKQREAVECMASICLDSVVTADGEPMFASIDEVLSLPIEILGKIVNIVSGAEASEVQGNVSGGTNATASSIS